MPSTAPTAPVTDIPVVGIACTDGEFEFTVTSHQHDGTVEPIVVNLDPYHTPLHQANLLADAVREIVLRQAESWTGEKIERPAPTATTGPEAYHRPPTPRTGVTCDGQTPSGVCDRPLDGRGYCDRASGHIDA